MKASNRVTRRVTTRVTAVTPRHRTWWEAQRATGREVWRCPGRRLLAIRTDQPAEKWDAWRHEDGTPCEGRVQWELRLNRWACGLERGHALVYLSASTIQRKRGRRHCLFSCRRLGRPPTPVSLALAVDLQLTPCSWCAHDGNGRTNPARWLAQPYPREPRCRPGGRREWLDAMTPGRPDLGVPP